MTAVFTHIWFSKWISLSLHYWSESQYNECLPWRWHRGGLILPHFPKWIYLKYSTHSVLEIQTAEWSQDLSALACAQHIYVLCKRNKNNHCVSELSWGCSLMKVLIRADPNNLTDRSRVDWPPVPPRAWHLFLCVAFTSCWPAKVLQQLRVHNYCTPLHPGWLCFPLDVLIRPSCVKDTAGILLQMSWFTQCGSCAHGRNSEAILAILITSLLSSCCCCRCWLSSVVSGRPPHVPLCYCLSSSLGYSPSYFSSMQAQFVWLVLLYPK